MFYLYVCGGQHSGIFYLAAAPVPSGKFGRGLDASFLGRMIASEIGDLGGFLGISGAAAEYDRQVRHPGRFSASGSEG